jgi:hypothetical protein
MKAHVAGTGLFGPAAALSWSLLGFDHQNEGEHKWDYWITRLCW